MQKTCPASDRYLAAQVVLSWSHHGRVVSEAAFARLAGVAPIPASSGQTIRHRLDRSGDRRLNRALHQILITSRRTHPPTIAYIQRRIQRARAAAKRPAASSANLARSLYRLLENGHPADQLTNVGASLGAVRSVRGARPLGLDASRHTRARAEDRVRR